MSRMLALVVLLSGCTGLLSHDAPPGQRYDDDIGDAPAQHDIAWGWWDVQQHVLTAAMASGSVDGVRLMAVLAGTGDSIYVIRGSGAQTTLAYLSDCTECPMEERIQSVPIESTISGGQAMWTFAPLADAPVSGQFSIQTISHDNSCIHDVLQTWQIPLDTPMCDAPDPPEQEDDGMVVVIEVTSVMERRDDDGQPWQAGSIYHGCPARAQVDPENRTVTLHTQASDAVPSDGLGAVIVRPTRVPTNPPSDGGNEFKIVDADASLIDFQYGEPQQGRILLHQEHEAVEFAQVSIEPGAEHTVHLEYTYAHQGETIHVNETLTARYHGVWQDPVRVVEDWHCV